MALDPRTTEEVKNDLQSKLEGKIVKLTNFLETSFNLTWINAYAEQIHDLEVQAFVAQIAGWARYSGKTDLDETDLERLGVDGADPDEVTQYIESSHLDELAKLVGVERDPGQKATGQVTIQTASDTTKVNEGLEVSTQPDSDGNYLSFYVDADSDGTIEENSNEYVTPSSGSTEVTVDIIADSIGTEYNVGSGTITYLPDPDPGIEGVNNSNETTGGEPEQSNESLREDVQNAVFASSGGGTVAGIEGYIDENVNGVSDVSLDEFYSQQPPYVDVIVDGGSDTDVTDAISESRPAGVEHRLVRPENINLGVITEVVGSDIDTSFVSNQIEDYLLDLSLNDEFRRSILIHRILNADTDVEDVGSLSVQILDINGESKTYQSGTSIYELDFAPLGKVRSDERLYDTNTNVYSLSFDNVVDSSVTVRAYVDNEWVTLTNDTDYDVVDDNGDGNLDAIDFSIGGSDPDDRTVFDVDYETDSWTIASTIEDESGDTYDKGTDWDLVDNDGDGIEDSIDWSIGGSTPDDGEQYTVDYNPDRIIVEDLNVSKREKVGSADSVTVTQVDSKNV